MHELHGGIKYFKEGLNISYFGPGVQISWGSKYSVTKHNVIMPGNNVPGKNRNITRASGILRHPVTLSNFVDSVATAKTTKINYPRNSLP